MPPGMWYLYEYPESFYSELITRMFHFLMDHALDIMISLCLERIEKSLKVSTFQGKLFNSL